MASVTEALKVSLSEQDKRKEMKILRLALDWIYDHLCEEQLQASSQIGILNHILIM